MKKLHIISFDIPFPPNYGGIIDVFFKIKELYKLDIEIYLHTFFKDLEKQPELEKYCKKIYYYPRGNSFISCFSLLPFRVKSRINKQLVYHLNTIKAPILYEGLHCAYLLTKNKFSNNYLRAHNIEHTYFYGLAKSEKNVLKKIFFFTEAIKLKFFEKNLSKTDGVFSISELEQDYFSKNYGEKSVYIPAFHEATFNKHKNKKGSFVLWHGDLRVADNIKAALFLIDVYKGSEFNLKIASSVIPKIISEQLKALENIEFVNLKSNSTLEKLFLEAHINVLYTYQNTGIKLKLLNALYKGKFVIGNTKLIEKTGLEELCELANTKEEILKITKKIFDQEFLNTIIDQRKLVLYKFSPENSAQKIVDSIFKP